MDKGDCCFNARDVELALYQCYFNPLCRQSVFKNTGERVTF